MTLAEQLVQAATAKGITLSTAESCTGGMVSAAITDIPGSSAVFDRGFVTYSNDAKAEMLGVRRETLVAHGAVSEPVALEMARGARGASGADIAVSITGIAGPGGSEHKPEGRVCYACVSEGQVQLETQNFGALGRALVRRTARDHALRLLLDAVQGAP